MEGFISAMDDDTKRRRVTLRRTLNAKELWVVTYSGGVVIVKVKDYHGNTEYEIPLDIFLDWIVDKVVQMKPPIRVLDFEGDQVEYSPSRRGRFIDTKYMALSMFLLMITKKQVKALSPEIDKLIAPEFRLH